MAALIKPRKLGSGEAISNANLFRVQAPVQPVTLSREANPFSPEFPDSGGGISRGDMIQGGENQSQFSPSAGNSMATLMIEQTEQIRKSHDMTQAGDTTVPWEFLTKVGPYRLFTLGAQGKFYHDDYGIIVAVYVEFTDMVEADFVNAPCGRKSDSSGFGWKVTNDFDKSSADLAVGIIASYEMPQNGFFGWVITGGANHAGLKLSNQTPPVQGEDVVWDGTGTMGTGKSGVKLGEIATATGEGNLNPGLVALKTGGDSAEKVRGYLANTVAELNELIQGVSNEVAGIDAATTNAAIENLVNDLGTLSSRLTSEINTRGSAIQSVLQTIANLDFASTTDLTGAVNTITMARDALEAQLRLLITAAQTRADAAYALANGATNYQPQIDSLNTAILSVNTKLEAVDRQSRMVPLVTTDVPAVFMQESDGTLIIGERP